MTIGEIVDLPPEVAASVEHGPTWDMNDRIVRASLRADDHLSFTLDRGGKTVCSSVVLPAEWRECIADMLNQMTGLSIEEMGQLEVPTENG